MDKAQLVISDVVYPGKGLARMVDGCVVFVRGVLQGETVEVEITKRKKKHAEARLVSVLQPSPQRVVPKCPLAGTCPGCCYQHVEYNEEVRIKQSQFINLLQRQAGLDTTSIVQPPIPSPVQLGYRNKITFHAAERGPKSVALGYFAEDNETIIDIDSCPLALPPLNAMLSNVRRNSEFMGQLRTDMSVTLRHTDKDGVLCWRGRLRTDEPWLTESTSLGPVYVPRGSFFQINPHLADKLVAQVAELLGRIGAGSAIDLYCGVGVFALTARLAGINDVVGVDSDELAIRAAEGNVLERKLDGIRFVAASAMTGLNKALQTMKPDGMVVIVDPPRMGLEKEVVAQLATAKPSDIIYVSCAPDTLARDIALLAKAEYRVLSARLLDMFPRTPHFESVTHLTKATVR